MEKKIHNSDINNKSSKICTDGMGIRRKKERKAYEMSRGKKSDFERIGGEGILRVKNENQAKTRKN